MKTDSRLFKISKIGYVKAQTGLKGLSSLAHDTAGDVINTALDVITSIL